MKDGPDDLYGLFNLLYTTTPKCINLGSEGRGGPQQTYHLQRNHATPGDSSRPGRTPQSDF
jgi:hypothetical protein